MEALRILEHSEASPGGESVASDPLHEELTLRLGALDLENRAGAFGRFTTWDWIASGIFFLLLPLLVVGWFLQ